MITDRVHPDKVDAYLKSCGIDYSQLEGAYAALNLRRLHLLDCYRMKRNVRIIGVLVVIISLGIPGVLGEQKAVVISLGLMVYGIALAVTGNLTIRQR